VSEQNDVMGITGCFGVVALDADLGMDFSKLGGRKYGKRCVLNGSAEKDS
jgi:hypothetical protein